MANKSRLPLALGVTALGGIGFYLYSAGGDTKAARNQAEGDAHKFKGRVQDQGQQAATDAQKLGKEAGAKFDNAVAKTQAELQKAQADAEARSKDAKDAALKKVNEFDKKVEDEASKAKSGLSSWFGGSNK
ncbi:hypothetical protein F5X96DRAFT_614511 [Biscogniauxia mediterranea]|nr:hypothetical protein F5X96DRAFT_614511 [Biscogniauxia mediterranea]